MIMLTSHALLLQYRHDSWFVFSPLSVLYVDRGALGDLSCMEGSMIAELADYYFEINTVQGKKCIPYHRLRKIAYEGKSVWER